MTQQPETMPELLEMAAAHGPQIAIVCGEREITFGTLADEAGRSARRLKDWGVTPGDRVTLYAPNGIDWVIAYFGILCAGAVVNPVNILNTLEEVRFITQDCGATLLLIDDTSVQTFDTLFGLPPLMTIDAATGILPSLADPIGSGDGSPLPSINAQSPSTITYTSGTTGRPKGAVLSHRAVATNAAMTAYMHARTAKDRVATALPLAHAYGAAVLNSSLLVGATLCLSVKFDANKFLEELQYRQATVIDGVPTMYAYMLALDALDVANLSSLRCCLVGGQSMPEATMAEVERRFKAPLIELWGMTEVAGLGTTHDVRLGYKHGSIGVALPGNELRVADPQDSEKTLMPGEVGELLIRGPTLMLGYWNQPEATAATIDHQGWLHSGDLATADADGGFSIVDRKKDLILSGGYNVYPAEIERVLAEHPDVAIVAVGKENDPARGEVPIAYIVLKPGAPQDEAALFDHCRTRLARYKLPRGIHFVDDVPKTSTGKIMRRALNEGQPS